MWAWGLILLPSQPVFLQVQPQRLIDDERPVATNPAKAAPASASEHSLHVRFWLKGYRLSLHAHVAHNLLSSLFSLS